MVLVNQRQFKMTLLTFNFALANRTQLTVNRAHRMKNSGQLIDKKCKKADGAKKDINS